MKIFFFPILLFFSTISQAQENEKPNFPPFGIGLANGITFGNLGDQKFTGYANQLRLIRVFNTYPPLFLGLDGAFATLNFKDDLTYSQSDGEIAQITDLRGKRYSLGVSAGFMVPLDLFIKSSKIPRGAGPLIIAGYNFVEQTTFENFEETINGNGYKLAFQMPLPISQKFILAFQFEYYRNSYDKTDEIPVFLDSQDLSLHGWNIALQIGVPLGKKRTE